MNGNDVELIAQFCRDVQLYYFHLDGKLLFGGELGKTFNIFDSII